MSRLKDVAALVYVSPAVQDLTRSYTVEHLTKQSVKAAQLIAKGSVDPHLTAMIFGAKFGSTLASLGEAEIQAAVEQAAKAVELIEASAEVADAEAALEAGIDNTVVGGDGLPGELIAGGEGGDGKTEDKQPEPPKELTAEVLAMAVADLAIATAYKKALVAANMNTVADVLKYDADNKSEGGLEKAKDIGKVARERILEAIKSL